MKLLIVEAEYAPASEPADGAIGRFLDEKFPGLNPPDHAAFLNLIRDFEQGSKVVKVILPDVFLMKCLCETIFRDTIAPTFVRKLKGTDLREASKDQG